MKGFSSKQTVSRQQQNVLYCLPVTGNICFYFIIHHHLLVSWSFNVNPAHASIALCTELLTHDFDSITGNRHIKNANSSELASFKKCSRSHYNLRRIKTEDISVHFLQVIENAAVKDRSSFSFIHI